MADEVDARDVMRVGYVRLLHILYNDMELYGHDAIRELMISLCYSTAYIVYPGKSCFYLADLCTRHSQSTRDVRISIRLASLVYMYISGNNTPEWYKDTLHHLE